MKENNTTKIKDVDDYIDIIAKRYKFVPKKVIKRVLEYGFEKFYNLNKKGADVHVCNSTHRVICGKQF